MSNLRKGIYVLIFATLCFSCGYFMKVVNDRMDDVKPDGLGLPSITAR